jgi:hypothetical protein
MQKITIIIVVLTFIPITLFGFGSQKVEVSDDLQKAYSIFKAQLNFITGLTRLINKHVS